MDAFLARLDAATRGPAALPDGTRALLAVSGGRDSMALLCALTALAPARGWTLAAAHFDHRLRGAAGRLDGELVAESCARLGLPCLRGEAPAPGPQKGASPEAAARARRLAFLAAAARQFGAACVVTAHHADDQAELVLLRLLRGAGGEGLGGMTAADPFPGAPDLRLVRPFLGFSRAEIAAWAAAQGVPFREDETNADVRRPRNRLRHRLLPLLTAEFQPALREVLARAAEITGAEADFVARAAADWLGSPPGRRAFDALHVAVQRAVLRRQLFAAGVAAEYTLVERLRREPGRPVNAPAGRRFRRDAAGRVEEVRPPPPFSPDALWVAPAAEGRVDFAGLQLAWRPAAGDEPLRVRRAVLEHGWHLRGWQPGDRFHLPGLPRPAKLQDIFVNRKVPAAERRRRVLAADPAGAIFWVEGLPLASGAVAASGPAVAWHWSRPAA